MFGACAAEKAAHVAWRGTKGSCLIVGGSTVAMRDNREQQPDSSTHAGRCAERRAQCERHGVVNQTNAQR